MKTLFFYVSIILVVLLVSCNSQQTKIPATENAAAESTAITADSNAISSVQKDSTAVKEKKEKKEQEEKDEKDEKEEKKD